MTSAQTGKAAKRLACAVLVQAIHDLQHGTEYVRQGVVAFFESGDFILYCTWLELSPDIVYNRYREIVELNGQKTFSFLEMEELR